MTHSLITGEPILVVEQSRGYGFIGSWAEVEIDDDGKIVKAHTQDDGMHLDYNDTQNVVLDRKVGSTLVQSDRLILDLLRTKAEIVEQSMSVIVGNANGRVHGDQFQDILTTADQIWSDWGCRVSDCSMGKMTPIPLDTW